MTSVKESPEDGRAILGCSFSITCNVNLVRGLHLLVEIFRQKESKTISVAHGTSSLVYSEKAAKIDHAGTYICRVTIEQDYFLNPLETMVTRNSIQFQSGTFLRYDLYCITLFHFCCFSSSCCCECNRIFVVSAAFKCFKRCRG